MSDEKVNTSLTAPADKVKSSGYSLKSTEEPLSTDQLKHAFKDLNVDSTLEPLYNKLERTYADPKISDQ